MATEPERLQAIGQSLASVADGLSASFAKELARVLASVNRALGPLLTDALAGSRTARSIVPRALVLRTELQAALTRAGYQRLVETAANQTVSQMASVFRAGRGAQNAGGLGRLTPLRLQALERLLAADLLGVGRSAAHTAWRAAAQAIYSQKPVEALIAEIARALEKSFAQARTVFDTQVSVVGRQIEAIATEASPEQAYLYVGPVDAKTRDWCLDKAGRVYTRDRIDALDNGQLPNPFLTGGGFNCRHTFLAVSDPALVAIANTDQRAPGYDGRVNYARTLKTQAKRFRELRPAA